MNDVPGESVSTLCSGACATRHHTRTCAASIPIVPLVDSNKSEPVADLPRTTETGPGLSAARALLTASYPAWLLLLCIAILAVTLTPCAPDADWSSVVLCACIMTFVLEVTAAMGLLLPLSIRAWTLCLERGFQQARATALRCISRNSWLSRPVLGLLYLMRPWIALLMPTPPLDPDCPRTRSRSLARTSVSSCVGL